MYIARHGEKLLKKFAEWFPVVLVTGARQVGKSTLLHHCLPQIRYITMDDGVALEGLLNDTYGFLQNAGVPVIYDEIQKAGAAFSTFKLLVDRDRHPGMFYLTGSQKFSLMQRVSDSMAGRIGILELGGLSGREIFQDEFDMPFLPTEEYLRRRNSKIKLDSQKLWKHIHRGGYPALWENEDLPGQMFYDAYVQTYLERDVRQLTQVGDLLAFRRFMVVMASRIGGILNLAAVARDAEIDVKTAKRWLSVLEASNIVFLLQPFGMNAAKRVIKAPKLYFYDTGLVCYLTKWQTADTAQAGAQAGALYENYVVAEIIKTYSNAGVEPPVYYFREAGGREIDLLFYQDNTLYPLEIKKTASPNLKDIKNFSLLQEFFPQANIGEGGVVCMYDKLLPLDAKNWVIPIECI